jgi:Leucine-rich repeat (LRR) protein
MALFRVLYPGMNILSWKAKERLKRAKKGLKTHSMKENNVMNNNTSLFGSAAILAVGTVTINDIYLIIVASGILVSSIISIINAIRNNKNVQIDSTVYDQLKEIQDQLDKSKEEESKDDSIQQ